MGGAFRKRAGADRGGAAGTRLGGVGRCGRGGNTGRENHLSFRSSTGTVLYLVYYPPFLSFSIPKFSLKELGLSFVTTEQDVTGQLRA